MLFLLFLIFRSIIQVNIRIGGNKKTEIFNFFSIGGSLNQLKMKKGLMNQFEIFYSMR